MTDFETQFFQKITFTPGQIKQYFESAERDYAIAAEADIPEVTFKFAYDALIKVGIALIAKQGYKVRSQTGHHVKILEKLSEILRDEDIVIMGNVMRQNRNRDFYDGGVIVTETEARQYAEFVAPIIEQARQAINYEKAP